MTDPNLPGQTCAQIELPFELEEAKPGEALGARGLLGMMIAPEWLNGTGRGSCRGDKSQSDKIQHNPSS